jgi:hypothetical protein
VSGAINQNFQPAVTIVDITKRLNGMRVELARYNNDLPPDARERFVRMLDTMVSELGGVTSAMASIPSVGKIIHSLFSVASELGQARELVKSGRTNELPKILATLIDSLLVNVNQLSIEAQRASEMITDAIRRGR